MKTMVGCCFALVACGSGSPAEETDETGSPLPGACGATSSMDVTVAGTVEDDARVALAGVDLRLEERNWSPGTVHATAISGSTGAFELAGADLPVVEGCWGTAVSYWLVAEHEGLVGEKHVNSYLEDAWNAGEDRVELLVPLVLR